MTETRKLRRQAAWLCFTPYLNDAQRLEAIRILEQSYQVDGVIKQIHYISAVCKRYGIDDNTRKTLNLEFHQLLTEPLDSVPDPLSMLPDGTVMPATVIDSTDNDVKAKPAPTAAKSRRPPLPARILVFSQLVFQVQDACSFKDLFTTLRYLVNEGPNPCLNLVGCIERWSEKPGNFSWALKLEERELKQFVHLLYTAVCDVLGPVEADRCFHKALAACEKRAEAKEYPPANFL